jgi:hypothetical protein
MLGGKWYCRGCVEKEKKRKKDDEWVTHVGFGGELT